MTQLTLAASNPALASMPPHQWAHDIRNILGTIGLHLETLEKLSGPAGGKAASAALALISRGGGMCAGALAEASGPQTFEPPARLRPRQDDQGSRRIARTDRARRLQIPHRRQRIAHRAGRPDRGLPYPVQPRPERRRRRPAPDGLEPALDRRRPQGDRDRGAHFRRRARSAESGEGGVVPRARGTRRHRRLRSRHRARARRTQWRQPHLYRRRERRDLRAGIAQCGRPRNRLRRSDAVARVGGQLASEPLHSRHRRARQAP